MPPKPDGLVAVLDAALVQEVLDVAQLERMRRFQPIDLMCS
jgi:hypothetical protein